MTYNEANSKYSKFYVTRYSSVSGRHVQVGKPHATIEEALAAAARLDTGKWMTFVDVVKPK